MFIDYQIFDEKCSPIRSHSEEMEIERILDFAVEFVNFGLFENYKNLKERNLSNMSPFMQEFGWFHRIH